MDTAIKTVAYLRVSTRSQDLANQKPAILDYAQQKQFAVDRFIELQVSSRKVRHKERVGELLGSLKPTSRLSTPSCPRWAVWQASPCRWRNSPRSRSGKSTRLPMTAIARRLSTRHPPPDPLRAPQASRWQASRRSGRQVSAGHSTFSKPNLRGWKNPGPPEGMCCNFQNAARPLMQLPRTAC